MNRTLTAVLADDHAAILDNVSRCLSPVCEIVAAVSDGTAAVEAIIRLHPDIAVLDIAMPQLSGIEVAREVRLLGSDTKVVFLTVQEDEDYISAALETGALGYVLKGRMRSDLPQAIEHAIAGDIFISSRQLRAY